MYTGGLFEGLPDAKNSEDGKSGAPVAVDRPKLFAPTTLSGRRSVPAARGRGRGRGPGPVGARPAGAAAPAQESVAEASRRADAAAAEAIPSSAQPPISHASLGVEDEYDPARPNDFIQSKRRLEAARARAEAEAARQEELREQRLRQEREARGPSGAGERAGGRGGWGADWASSGEQPPPPGGPHEAALPPDGEEERLRQATSGVEVGVVGGSAAAAPQVEEGGGPESAPAPLQGPSAERPKRGMAFAQRMLEKMGWREGEGLGRHHQGLHAPLEARKVSATSGIIVSAGGPAARRPPSSRSRVLLLRGLAAPGEAEGIDAEVGIECSRYGEVLSALVFEVTEPAYPADRAVRVFVRFATEEGAEAARRAMAGRVIGGKVADCRPFDERRFDLGDLGPGEDE